MRRSSNEFCATLAKAGVAAGFPPDLAEEIALAAALLCVQGSDGVGAAMHSLRGGMAAAAALQYRADRICATRTCAAAVTIAVAEALCAAWHDAQPCRAVLDEVDSPLLLTALVAVAAAAQHLRYQLRFSGAGGDTANAVTVHIPQANCLLPTPADMKKITALTALTAPNAQLEVLGVCAVTAALPAQGLEVHPVVWGEVETLASQTKVSASAESRQEGAGAGEIDND